MGFGVEATPLPEIDRFNEIHDGVVRTGAGVAAFELAIAVALSDRAQAQIARRVAVTRTTSWASRLDQMSNLIEDALAMRMRPVTCAVLQAS